MAPAVLAIDQGTSATKGVLVDAAGRIVARSSVAIAERYPQPGWVEQDADEIWRSVRSAAAQCLAQRADLTIAAVGLSTQRESALVWQRSDCSALTPLLSWQDRRTVELRERHAAEGAEADVRERSGLPLDPMFSALKIEWLLDSIDPDRRRASAGELRVGTVDAFLLDRLGADGVVEVGSASRTQLLNVHRFAWDAALLARFRVPPQALPRVVASAAHHADAAALHPSLEGVPVLAAMADSHAALYAHGAREVGDVKATMGTGSSVMGLAGTCAAPPHPGLCLTVAWDDGRGPLHALEGNIRATGSTLRWVADLFGLSSEDAAALAARSTSDGVCLVPGFNGLGAPWWDPRAVGLLTHLTLDTGRGQLLAAAVESIAHQIADVLEAMDTTLGADAARRLLVDGGPSRNAALRATLANYIGRPVVHCADPELSALGAAHLAGLGAGLWDAAALRALPRAQQETAPAGASSAIHEARARWARAIAQSRHRESAAAPPRTTLET